MIRIVPLWPRHRYLELAPKYWATTRARLGSSELAHELGPLTIPPATIEQPRRPEFDAALQPLIRGSLLHHDSPWRSG